ncbi:MAG: prepilin-type N-terminal cleavage/methylation domain-containing protein [bacterium]|nr:prepilin-type N-terminal cleavage/methylation domain-containing protein [bacterium]MDD5354531.1 prepilin-type N-terminal cleavage/methylation domain-containing protein [bacterium]MDD5755904.1 prepilin-type N-terminal cleavage/methylation domain-containing protein [bacterium]
MKRRTPKLHKRIKRLLRKAIRVKYKGFTLVELLIVIVIIGILAAVVISRFTGATKDAKEAGLKANLSGLRSQVEIYRARSASDSYPTNLQALVTEGYIRKIPQDPFYKKSTEYTTLQAAGIGGWVYSNATGQVYVDIPSNDPAGLPKDTSWGEVYTAW